MLLKTLLIPFFFFFFFFFFNLSPTLLLAASPYPHDKTLTGRFERSPLLSSSKRYEGSSDLVHVRYHMGPVLSAPIRLHLIWYGRWLPAQQAPIRDFLLSLSDAAAPSPSAAEWWRTVALYPDQTGANASLSVAVAAEAHLDPAASRGRSLSRLAGVQGVIADALASGALPAAADPRGGAYLVLTRAVCGFHYFTFPALVGRTVPYAWVGHSGEQCPEVCAYPFAIPSYMKGAVGPMRAPNGDAGVDGMVSVVAHELAEMATNPLVNAWYAGDEPAAPAEIADLCEGVYGTGGGGGYTGAVSTDARGGSFNLNGRNGRRFLVQWVWSPQLNACVGPNARD
ncbi:protein EXORDIUM-like 5 [Ananas comosus]|uniref:Protein EXORDIUM-like 5 n=1 Tax=Ananas comosus TaxID=4615 RepID=A0A6P5FCW9_ANACO|nr:protein EXORDIUM-like 5 [Ananas comosus]